MMQEGSQGSDAVAESVVMAQSPMIQGLKSCRI
jgi:hypothetical protein